MSITRVNFASGSNYSGFTFASIAAAAQSHTAGNALIVGVRAAKIGGGPVITVTDTAGNTFRQIGQSFNFSATVIELWVAKNITGHATNVVQGNFSVNAGFIFCGVIQYSGLDLDLILDQFASVVGARSLSAGTITTPAITTNKAEEVLVSFASADATGGSWTPGSGFTEIFDDGTVHMQEMIVSSIQTGVTMSTTYSATPARDILGGSFLGVLEAGGGSPGSPSPGSGAFETGFAHIG